MYQYNVAASRANGSSHAADLSFALAAGNTNPQGIADPPAPGSELLAFPTTVVAGDFPPADARAYGADQLTWAAPGSHAAHRLSDAQRRVPGSHRVDQFMTRLESELGTVRSATSVSQMTAPHTPRATAQRSNLWTDDLNATIDSIVDDLATSTSRRA